MSDAKEMKSPVALFGGADESVPPKTAAEIYQEMFAPREEAAAPAEADPPPVSKP